MNKRPDDNEGLQRHIAERMGITWEAYAARCTRQVTAACQSWPSGWARLKFAWLPDRLAVTEPHYGEPFEASFLAADQAHNTAILAAIPKSSPPPSFEPLSLAVREFGHEGTAVKFLGARCIEVFGMRGYRPVFNGGEPVRVGSLYMCEISQHDQQGRRERLAEEAQAAVEEGMRPTERVRYMVNCLTGLFSNPGGDVCRLTWHIGGWRGVLALYEYPDAGTVRRGIELQTQWYTRYPKLRRLRFYKLPVPA